MADSRSLEPSEMPAKPAATVMLLRDGSAGIEVFMLRRTRNAAFAGGMYVFPGGKLDPGDGEGEEAYAIAAIRECYEEAGILLATDEAGRMVADGHPALDRRQDVYAGDLDLRALCHEHGLTPAILDLVWVSHWITPVGESSRRFDTRFFVAIAPTAQTSRHDDNETIASEWVRPQDALQRQAAGELTMMPPTIVNLEFVGAHANAADAMRSARQLPQPTPIQPKWNRGLGGRFRDIALPGEVDYDELTDTTGPLA